MKTILLLIFTATIATACLPKFERCDLRGRWFQPLHDNRDDPADGEDVSIDEHSKFRVYSGWYGDEFFHDQRVFRRLAELNRNRHHEKN